MRCGAAVSITAIAACGYPALPAIGSGDAGPILDAPVPDATLSGVDAMVDSPPGTTCYGPSGWQVCLGAGLGSKTLSGTINTDTSPECLAAAPPGWGGLQPDACFIVAEVITVSTVLAVGSRPLALVATSQLTVTGLLDVASHGSTRGAGSQSIECKPFLRIPANGGPPGDTGGGGGAGGSFMSRGGDGGSGDAGNHQNGLAADPILGVPMRLRGGCAGQPGGGLAGTGGGGAGGGAVYLLSGGKLTIMGSINVSGGGGLGGVDGADESPYGGGGGGGSGGLIVLYGASSIATSTTTTLVANGGGGGGGAAAGGDPQIANGRDGNDPLVTAPTTPAAGGAAGTSGGGNGGAGGSGYPAAAAATGGIAGDMNSGGGGGGGGKGYIQANQDLGQAQCSPPTTIR